MSIHGAPPVALKKIRSEDSDHGRETNGWKRSMAERGEGAPKTTDKSSQALSVESYSPERTTISETGSSPHSGDRRLDGGESCLDGVRASGSTCDPPTASGCGPGRYSRASRRRKGGPRIPRRRSSHRWRGRPCHRCGRRHQPHSYRD